MSQRAPTTPPLPGPVVAALRCSVCGSDVTLGEHTLRCERGHAFDIARQGYVNLLHAKVPSDTADTAEMVAARADFLASGFYAPLADALAERARGELVVDAGAGTGYYLARVLQRQPGSAGLALDVSAPALRRAARAHPRIGAAVWNLWRPWPVRSGVADVVLNVFAPRNATEFHRVLRPGGTLVVAVPAPTHLRELADRFGLLTVDTAKQRRLDATLAEKFALCETHDCGATVTLPPADVRRAVLMGPNAHHRHRDGLAERLESITEPVEVTTAFRVSTYRRV